ncbi:MAG: PKD domain-containing protein [Bacteroidota bacterium]
MKHIICISYRRFLFQNLHRRLLALGMALFLSVASFASNILFVVGDVNLSNADDAVYQQLVGSGHTITVVDDGASSAADASGQDAVVISASCNSGNVNSKFRDVATPVIVYEPYIYDDMDMTGNANGSDFGGIWGNQDDLDIEDPSHPLAGGLTGAVSTMNSWYTTSFSFGNPTGSASIIAEDPNQNKAVIFAYEAGVQMDGLVAPAKRVGFFLYEDSGEKLNANGWILFDAAIAWVTTASGDPIADIVATPSSGTAPLSVSFDGAGSSDDGTIVQYDWDFGDGNLASGSAVSHIYATVGSFDATLTVTDDEGNSSSAQIAIQVSYPVDGEILFITNGSTPQAPHETAVITELQNRGYTVLSESQNATSSASAVGKSLIVISGACGTTAGSHFINTDVPAIAMGPDGQKGLGLTGDPWNTTFGQDYGETQISVLDDSHQIMDGLTGLVDVYNGSNTLVWSDVSTSTKLASTDSDPDKATIYVYETGEAMYNGSVAPERRVGFFVDFSNANQLTSTGWDLLENAMIWAIDPVIPPVIDFQVSSVSSIPGQPITFNAAGANTLSEPIVSYVWDFGDGQSAQGILVSHVYQQAGSYTVSLTITTASGTTFTIDQLVPILPDLASGEILPPMTCLTSAGTDQSFSVTTLDDGNSYVVGKSNLSDRVHHQVRYRLNNTNSFIWINQIEETLPGPPPTTTTTDVCRIYNVAGLPNGFVDCSSFDIDDYQSQITETLNNDVQDYDMLVSKINDQNEIEWSRSYGSMGFDFWQGSQNENIVMGPDGLLHVSMTYSRIYTQPLDVMMHRIDPANGDLVSSDYLHPTNHGGDIRLSSLAATSTGKIIATGPSNGGGWTAFLLEINTANEEDIENDLNVGSYGTPLFRGHNIFEDANGDYIQNGYSVEGSATYAKVVAYRPSLKDAVWSRRSTHADPSSYIRIMQLKTHPNGGYAGVGFAKANGSLEHAFIIRLDASGQLLWSKLYAPSISTNIRLNRIDFDASGEILAAGHSYWNTFLMKVSEVDGTQMWHQIYTDETPINPRPEDLKSFPSGKIVIFSKGNEGGIRKLTVDANGLPAVGFNCLSDDHSFQLTTSDAGIGWVDEATYHGGSLGFQYTDVEMNEFDKSRGCLASVTCCGEIGDIPTPEECAANHGSATPGMNRIISRSMREAITADPGSLLMAGDLTTQIAYFDGLGRPLQSIAVQATPNCQDLISFSKYDHFGRQPKVFLPFVDQGVGGAFRAGDQSGNQDGFFIGLFQNSGGEAYTLTDFEPSPLNRVLAQSGPGADFHLHPASTQYLTNGANEVYQYPLDGTPPFAPGYYDAGELYLSQTTDENGGITKTYTDKLGRTILNSVQVEGNTYANTYFIYDVYGNVRYVVPPEASKIGVLSTDVLNSLCFQYTYDARHRIMEKKVPGADWVHFIYNELDQLVFTQDGNLRDGTYANGVANSWLFNKYDAIGRPILTGIHTGDRATLETGLTNNPLFENPGPGVAGYTNIAYPLTPDANSENLHSISWFDSYEMDGANIPAYAPESEVSVVEPELLHLQGQVTGVELSVLDASITERLRTITYFDAYGRELQTHSKHLHGTDISTSLINFAGETELSVLRHQGPVNDIRLIKRMAYDHTGRLLQTTLQAEEAGVEVISETLCATYEYDDLGQMVEKNLHSEDGGLSFWQSVDHQYNIRGWITAINGLEESNWSGNDNDQYEDLFGMDLAYNKPSTTGGATPLYNGNISEWRWTTATPPLFSTEPLERAYTYEYDLLNRVKAANYRSNKNGDWNTDLNAYSTEYRYDLNGNIDSLRRKAFDQIGVIHQIDDLAYAYDPANQNRLTGVKDWSNIPEGFEDDGSYNDYTYDASGNIITDANKGITVVYNHLNKPVEINFDGTANKIAFIYDAIGTKLQQIVSGTSEKTNDYISGFFYEENDLRFFSHDEGRAVKTDEGNLRLEYNLVDHLGNVRVTFSDTSEACEGPVVLSEDHYYPFGLQMPFLSETAGEVQRFKYNGKELHQEYGLGWYDYGARMYDPAIGRWNANDPLAEMYGDWSPYNYVMGNPLASIDPDGMQTQRIQDFDGNWHEIDDDDVVNVYQTEGASGPPLSNPNEWSGENHGSFSDPNGENPANVSTIYDPARSRTYYVARYNTDEGSSWMYYDEGLGRWQVFLPYTGGNGRWQASHQRNWQYGLQEGINEMAPLLEASATMLEVTAYFMIPGTGSGGAIARGATRLPLTSIATRKVVILPFSKSGANFVYQSFLVGTTQYVGITGNLSRRAAQHLATKGISIQPLLKGLSRADARAVEQALIEIHGLGKNGGTLLNKINSISPKRKIFKQQLLRGLEILKSIGYPVP